MNLLLTLLDYAQHLAFPSLSSSLHMCPIDLHLGLQVQHFIVQISTGPALSKTVLKTIEKDPGSPVVWDSLTENSRGTETAQLQGNVWLCPFLGGKVCFGIEWLNWLVLFLKISIPKGRTS